MFVIIFVYQTLSADMAFSGQKKKSTVINDYTINTDVKTTLGKGAYGIVYTAKDLNNVTVATKRIDERVLTQKLDKRGKRTQLDHENIVRMLNFYQDKEVKTRIEDKEEIAVERQKLHFEGELLEDTRSLFSYNIHEGSTLHLQ